MLEVRFIVSVENDVVYLRFLISLRATVNSACKLSTLLLMAVIVRRWLEDFSSQEQRRQESGQEESRRQE